MNVIDFPKTIGEVIKKDQAELGRKYPKYTRQILAESLNVCELVNNLLSDQEYKDHGYSPEFVCEFLDQGIRINTYPYVIKEEIKAIRQRILAGIKAGTIRLREIEDVSESSFH